MVTYGAEIWAINKSADKTLMIFKRNKLRNIFGLALKDNKWRIRTNVELGKNIQGRQHWYRY